MKHELLKRIALEYLNSDDFNGISARELIDVGDEGPGAFEEAIRALVADGDVYANFGHEMVNPYILGFPPQSANDNIVEVDRRGGVLDAVLYPRPRVLAATSAGDRYPGVPYSAALALGHAQLASVFFHAAVLGKYRDDPRYDYTLDIGGEIRGQDGTPLDTYLTTFSIGFNKSEENDEIVVGVPLRYLHDLSAAEQSYWKSFEHEDQGWVLHPDWVRPHLLGEFPERVSPYTAILMEMRSINDICDAIRYPALFRELYDGTDRPTDYGYLIRPTMRELSAFVEQLNKLPHRATQPEVLRARKGRNDGEKTGCGGEYLSCAARHDEHAHRMDGADRHSRSQRFSAVGWRNLEGHPAPTLKDSALN